VFINHRSLPSAANCKFSINNESSLKFYELADGGERDTYIWGNKSRTELSSGKHAGPLPPSGYFSAGILDFVSFVKFLPRPGRAASVTAEMMSTMLVLMPVEPEVQVESARVLGSFNEQA